MHLLLHASSEFGALFPTSSGGCLCDQSAERSNQSGIAQHHCENSVLQMHLLSEENCVGTEHIRKKEGETLFGSCGKTETPTNPASVPQSNSDLGVSAT
jgi:hypothetical protein